MMQKLNGIEIFKAGQHKAMQGRSANYPISMLHQVAANYDKNTYSAPIVIGHPKTDAPAYGWVSNLYVEGDVLKADVEQVDQAFVEMVQAGRYRNISSTFWQPKASANPKPGSYSLKHVGFLGAAAPAVKGLKPVQFSNEDDGILAFGEDDASFAHNEVAKAIQRYENQREIEKLVDAGKILPCFSADILAFTESLNNDYTASFAEGGDMGLRDWFLSYLEKQLPIVSFGAFDMDAEPELDSELVNMPAGFKTDETSMKLHARATQLAKEKGISFVEAAKQIDR